MGLLGGGGVTGVGESQCTLTPSRRHDYSNMIIAYSTAMTPPPLARTWSARAPILTMATTLVEVSEKDMIRSVPLEERVAPNSSCGATPESSSSE